MSKTHLSDKRFPVVIKLLALPVWWGISVSLMGVLLMHLWDQYQTPSPKEPQVVYSNTDSSYRLFTALPTKKNVLGQRIEYKDARVAKVRGFLEFYNSPMIDASEAFVQIADKYDLPWTLLPAIACKESGCGRAIPPGSYNAFGWAVYTGQNSGAVFNSWDAAIERVGRGLREEYFNRGFDTVPKIETRYTPPSANSHGGWRTHVSMFMNEIEGWPID